MSSTKPNIRPLDEVTAEVKKISAEWQPPIDDDIFPLIVALRMHHFKTESSQGLRANGDGNIPLHRMPRVDIAMESGMRRLITLVRSAQTVSQWALMPIPRQKGRTPLIRLILLHDIPASCKTIRAETRRFAEQLQQIK